MMAYMIIRLLVYLFHVPVYIYRVGIGSPCGATVPSYTQDTPRACKVCSCIIAAEKLVLMAPACAFPLYNYNAYVICVDRGLCIAYMR